jgi:hypothetical protein
MIKRVLLAAVLGGIAFFIWSSVAHVALPLGETGVKEIPNETSVLSAMQTSIGGTHGLYIFPGLGVGPNASRDQKNAAMRDYDQKLASVPSGFLIYHPAGEKSLIPHKLTTEFLTFASRVGIAVLMGLAAAIATNVPYWNWYGFPTNYTVAYMTIQVVGYLLAGLVAAAVLGRAAQAKSRAIAAS